MGKISEREISSWQVWHLWKAHADEKSKVWDARLLNEEMLEMVRREYPKTAERIETKSYYKWQEEHKKALSVLGQRMGV